MGKKNYRTCQLNSPLEKFWRVYVRVIFSSFSPYIDSQDSQKVKFCNFKWNVFALIYIFLMKMTYKNDPQSIFSERRQKNFYGRVSLLFFRGGGEIKLTSTVNSLKCTLGFTARGTILLCFA